MLPPSELNDYINLQKELKRLNEDNLHLSNENKELLNKLKNHQNLNVKKESDNKEEQQQQQDSSFLLNEFSIKQQQYEVNIYNLQQEIYVKKK